VAGSTGRWTLLWEQGGGGPLFRLRQQDGSGAWGPLCAQDGFRYGRQVIAGDPAGDVWLAYVSRTHFGLDVGRIFTAAGACLAGQPAEFTVGQGWNNLTLAAGSSGLALGGTRNERLRAVSLDPVTRAITEEIPAGVGVSYGGGAEVAVVVDGAGGQHLAWPEIEIGHSYIAPARYAYRDPGSGWLDPVTPMPESTGAGGIQLAVDGQDGVYMAWSDQSCAAPNLRKVYFATKPAFSSHWQVSDVSTPGYADFEDSPAMVLSGDGLYAAWGGFTGPGSSVQVLFGQSRVAAAAGILTATVTASQGGSAAAADGHVALDFPPGAVAGTVTVTYTRQLQPAQPTGGLRFAGRSFTLEARDAGGAPVTSFGLPYTITLRYDDADWQQAGLPDESSLNLYTWDGGTWVPILPCAGCSLDTEANRLIAVLDHMTEFALLGGASPRQIFLPHIGR
jgi:hypothetical protein